jgi:hypothetical protein
MFSAALHIGNASQYIRVVFWQPRSTRSDVEPEGVQARGEKIEEYR